MSKKLFNDQEQKILRANTYIKAVSEKGITYTDEFKAMAIKEFEGGKSSRRIFEDAWCDVDIVGIQRAKSALRRWRAAYKENGFRPVHVTSWELLG